jgi:MoaA/NifB/PqqE/SkfB family radical SAM enzyme
MIVNIEITTYCNFHCSYCYTPNYPNKHMGMGLFQQICKKHLSNKHLNEFRLNGEGEPLLHPKFWEMVAWLNLHACNISFITNGSTLTPSNCDLIKANIDNIYVSIDTLDVKLAEKIGRHNINKTVDNLKYLVNLGFENITIMLVDFGQDPSQVIDLAQELNISFFYQPLQFKKDYSSVYPANLKPVPIRLKPKLSCMFLNEDIMRFYNIDGVDMPCCFIKDTSKYKGIKDLITLTSKNIIPSVCEGCKFLN